MSTCVSLSHAYSLVLVLPAFEEGLELGRFSTINNPGDLSMGVVIYSI